jgi:4-diphosphocytidyl-2-C-methyl-D-erythritol kinase
MQTLFLKAPAKINLYLRVLKKRPDGFHNIETIFEKIDLCDEIILQKRKRGIKIICQDYNLPEDGRNLAFKAAQVLLSKVRPKLKSGVQITIVKNIPVACGLGGGSSDAASVLLGLNRLFALQQTRDKLLQLAAQLGADVPFFILPAKRALGKGKGEVLTPLKIERKNWYVLVIPPIAVSTRRMYRDSRLILTKPSSNVKIILRALNKGDLTTLDQYSYNSFGIVLRKKYKQVLIIKEALKSLGAKATLISGSGPCVFAVTLSRKEAMGISRKMRAQQRGWQIIVAKTYSDNSKNTDF